MPMTAIILLLCGAFIVAGSARGLARGRTEERDEFPPIRRTRNPIQFFLYVYACMAVGIAMILFGVAMLIIQVARHWPAGR